MSEPILPPEKLSDAQLWPLFVFLCSNTGQPMNIGFTPEEYDLCFCGAALEPVEVIRKPK